VVNQQCNDEGLRECALFAGAGGGILGGHLLGWRTICAVEYNAYARSVLLARQNDGTLAPFPVWDDVRTFDGKPWRGRVDVVSGGFPCQDLSSSGSGAGLDGERSGLWREMARIIGEVRPRFVFIENSPNLAHNGLARVLCDLAAMGFDAEWGVIGASDAGAPHQRGRIWIVADASGVRQPIKGELVWPFGTEKDAYREADSLVNAFQSKSLPFLCGSHDGMANSVERLTAIGNGQAPYAAATAWRILTT
jgi:DNA (cytosine-5)-methyltransferase 1